MSTLTPLLPKLLRGFIKFKEDSLEFKEKSDNLDNSVTLDKCSAGRSILKEEMLGMPSISIMHYAL